MDIHVDLVFKRRLFRESVASSLRSLDDSIKVNEQTDTECFSGIFSDLEMFGLVKNSDVVLLDGEIENLAALIACYKKHKPGLKTVLLVENYSSKVINDSLSAGVEGLISTKEGIKKLHHCLGVVVSDRLCYPAFTADTLGRHESAHHTHQDSLELGLTRQQTRVVQFIECGFSNKEIAKELDIELSTVKNHVHQILGRLNAKNRCEAVALYRRTGSSSPSFSVS